jgi:cyclophilin family peptidyl-prolyl cis-trans isomerase
VRGRRNRGYNPLIVAVAAVVLGGSALAIAVGNPFGSGASPSPSTSTGPLPSRALANCPTKAPTALAANVKKQVTIKTSVGNIVVEVGGTQGPLAAANFLALAECGFYDGVIFHRIVPGFVIQGGDGQFGWSGLGTYARAGQGGPGYKFADEPIIGEYTRGVLAMANSGANTNGSQFFITVADATKSLTKDYTIFGKVVSGMDVVDQIVAAPRNSNDLPNDPVVMEDFTIVNAPTGAPTVAPTAVPSPTPSAAPTAAASTAP